MKRCSFVDTQAPGDMQVQSPSFLNDTCSPAKPCIHCTATCTLYFFLTACNHATFSWPSPGPATAPHAMYLARGYGKDKHMRNTTELPTHLTAGRLMSFPNALACAEALPQCPCLRAFNACDFVQGQLCKMSMFLSRFPVTGLKF